MIIRRDLYLEKLIERKGNGLIKIVTGIRRCGKSFLLNNLFIEHLRTERVDTRPPRARIHRARGGNPGN